MEREQKIMLCRIVVSACILVSAVILKVGGWVGICLCAAAYLIAGYDTLLDAIRGIIRREMFDECFLMAVATLGAAALGDYKESAAVMLFYKLGELFEDAAVDKSRRNISALMDIRAEHANLAASDGSLERVDPESVETGAVIAVLPGERVPIDGVIIEGESTLDTSALTGESVPGAAAPGDEVLSGVVNMTGLLKIRTTRPFGESAASRILELVEKAADRKSKSENFIRKFARIYTPAVCFCAAALALIPPLVSLMLGSGADWSRWIYRALTFLVISCPCALVISIPLGFFAGLGAAGRAGILIKGSNFMETLSQVKYLVFDKTGTLTKGVFELTEKHPVNISEKELLEYAAAAEAYSTHPIAKSIISSVGADSGKTEVSEVREISGRGITAKINGKNAAVGNDKLMEELHIGYESCSRPGTVVHLALEGSYCGYLLISDIIKPEAEEAVRSLKKAGIKETVMLTGDNELSADFTARRLGIDRVYAGLLPENKVERVEELLKDKRKGEMLAFAGDGINDAPVLARADIGIAMGSAGSDAAIEAADVVLMDDDPRKIAKAIAIASKCIRIVRENIVFAVSVKLLCLAAGALGLAGMWPAVFADVGVMVLCVLNSIRIMGYGK